MNDKEMREPLFNYLENTQEKLRIFEELAIRKSIADVVVVKENTLTGIEIKSDCDTYARLATQIKDYDHFFDYNYIAVGKSHIRQAHKHIPPKWGILCIYDSNGNIVVEEVRKPQPNTHTKVKYQIKLLWRLELNNILAKNNLPKYKQKSKLFVKQKILERLPEDVLKQNLCYELFERDYTLLY